MSFFKRLFPSKSKKSYEPMRGSGNQLQTDEEQASVREKMEGEMAAEREKRNSAPKSE